MFPPPGGGGGGGGVPSPFNMMFPPHMMGGAGAGGGAVPPQGAPRGPAGFPAGLFGGFGGGGGADPLQYLFGNSQGGPVDPAVLQEVFGSGGMGFPGQQPAPQPTAPERAPATSPAALRMLPRVKVTAYDIVANEGSECAICIGDLEAGKTAIRLPCGHLFHEDCIMDWLKRSNECPVCRFELPSDNPEYERDRESRMAGRKLRMRRADLDMKSAQELRRLAVFISVDLKGCLEKSEIVDRIAVSPRVQIIQADSTDAAGGNLQLGAAQTFSPQQLDHMSIGEVRLVMERLAVDTGGCSDKDELLARLCMSGRIIVTEEVASPKASAPAAPVNLAADAPSAPAKPAAPATPFTPTGPLSSRSVGELRRLAREHHVSIDGCLEKVEIVQRLQAAGL